MRNKFNIFYLLIFFSVIVSIFYRWFTKNPIIGGDWPYLFKETLKEFSLIVPAWNTWQGNGLGGTNQTYFLQIFENFTVLFTNYFNIYWIIVYKVLWFGLFILLSILSSIFFSRKIFSNNNFSTWLLTSIIFTTNTYILMVVGGGQMGVALAYSVIPFVLTSFICVFEKNIWRERVKYSLIAGLVLAIEVMFDPRIAYLSLLANVIFTLFYFLINPRSYRNFFSIIFYGLLTPVVITFFLHSVWIFPYLFTKQNFSNDFGTAYSSVGIVKFLSFGSFSQAISLLHPNWPENIFGKVYFMRPEFLLLPVLAYCSLSFLKKTHDTGIKKEKTTILFFAFLGLFGAFLAKGTQDPFGFLYLIAFSHVPGFILFRDPTKFYMLTIVSFSILIPFSLINISKKIFGNTKHTYPIVFGIFLIFWLFTISPALEGKLTGTFKNHEVPKEYVLFKNLLSSQSEFFRTLWVPREDRFTFYSNEHPAVESSLLFNKSDSMGIISILESKNGKYYIEQLGIKYIVVPYDSLGEIFQKNRKYDDKEYNSAIKKLNSISWLKRLNLFQNMAVFEVSSFKDHIYLTNGGKLSYKMITPYDYKVFITINKPQNIIFSETYNPYWIVSFNNNVLKSKKTTLGLNSFSLNKTGTYSFDIYFSQEKLYLVGFFISGVSLVIVIILLYIFWDRKNILLRNR